MIEVPGQETIGPETFFPDYRIFIEQETAIYTKLSKEYRDRKKAQRVASVYKPGIDRLINEAIDNSINLEETDTLFSGVIVPNDEHFSRSIFLPEAKYAIRKSEPFVLDLC